MTNNLLNQIRKLQAKKIKMSNGKTYEQVLRDEAERLKQYIQEELNYARQDYYPISYKRTGMLDDSIRVDDIASLRVVGNMIQLNIRFDDANVIRESGFGVRDWHGSGVVNVATLYEFGYQVKKDVWFKNIPYFGYRSGTRFIGNAIDRFKAHNPYGLKIDCPQIDEYRYRVFTNA